MAIDFSTLLPLLAIAVGAGVVGGILAGLLGVGGGIVIVPALYLALSSAGMDPVITMQVAVGTSLATIVFTSLSSGYGLFKRVTIDMDLLRLRAPSLLVGVIIGALLGGYVSGLILVSVFAVVAALVAIDMIFRKPVIDPTVCSFHKLVWAALGTITGALSAMMGIGGGTIGAPLLNFLGYDIRRAVGTSAAIGFPGAIIYALTGQGTEGLPPFSLGYVNLAAAAIIIPMTSSFAHVGVKLVHSISRGTLRFAFGIFLMLTSLGMFVDLFSTLTANG